MLRKLYEQNQRAFSKRLISRLGKHFSSNKQPLRFIPYGILFLHVPSTTNGVSHSVNIRSSSSPVMIGAAFSVSSANKGVAVGRFCCCDSGSSGANAATEVNVATPTEMNAAKQDFMVFDSVYAYLYAVAVVVSLKKCFSGR
jgi:hypothetical protein